MNLREVATFSKVKVNDFGSVDEVSRFSAIVDDVVVVWTRSQSAENPFSAVDVRGVVSPTHGLRLIPDDATVTLIEEPRYAGQPDELLTGFVPIDPPAGSLREDMITSEGWPALIWQNDILFSPCQGWTDAELAVEILLCALAVAPEHDPELRPMLVAALRARYAKVVRDPNTYPPRRYPWLGRTAPGPTFMEYLGP